MHRCAGGQVLKNAVKTTEDLYLLFERVFRAVSVEVNDSRSIDARGLIDRRISLIAQAPFTSRSTQKKRAIWRSITRLAYLAADAPAMSDFRVGHHRGAVPAVSDGREWQKGGHCSTEGRNGRDRRRAGDAARIQRKIHDQAKKHGTSYRGKLRTPGSGAESGRRARLGDGQQTIRWRRKVR
jgi:hypothetical protein